MRSLSVALPLQPQTQQYTLHSLLIPLLTCHLWLPKSKAPYAILFVSMTTPWVILNTHNHRHWHIHLHFLTITCACITDTIFQSQSKTTAKYSSPPANGSQIMKVNVFFRLWFLMCSVDVIREVSLWNYSLFTVCSSPLLQEKTLKLDKSKQFPAAC